jgi:hypothetical protein
MQYSFSKFFNMKVEFGCSLIKGREKKKKKESGDSSENGICGCGLPACCCQPAVAGSVIYADLWGELSTHLARRLCLLRVLLCGSLCYKLSPFQAHWER